MQNIVMPRWMGKVAWYWAKFRKPNIPPTHEVYLREDGKDGLSPEAPGLPVCRFERCAEGWQLSKDQSGTLLCKVIAAQSGNAIAFETLVLIDKLRAEEGDSVTIGCDNPDFNGQPNCHVTCCGGWTGWEDERFTGDTVLECLRAAAADMYLRDG
jgi:hypothetical protein